MGSEYNNSPSSLTATLALARAMAAYLPECLAADLLRSDPQDQNKLPNSLEVCHFEAVAMLVDIAGFTPLCEALSRKGREGAEQISTLINSLFSQILRQIQQHGGVIVKFGGDAFQAFFPVKHAVGWDEAIRGALQAAFDLQTVLLNYNELRLPGQTFRFYAKVGLSAGQILTFRIGNPDLHCDFQAAGSPFTQAAQAEQQAKKGEVIAHQEFLNKTPDINLELGTLRANCFPVLNYSSSSSSLAPALFNLSELSQPTLDNFILQAASFVPRPIYERLKLGYLSLPGEHRPVASLFVNFKGFDWTFDAGAPAHFQEYYLAVCEEVDRYGGNLNRVSSGDKGDLLHIIFGAPVTYKDSEEQALRCALALQQVARRFSFITGQRIGLSGGFVFAGEIGSPTRHEYTVMGDTVNLSARLMQTADDWTILLDSATASRLQRHFDFTTPYPVQLKGKQVPSYVCQVLQPHEAASPLPTPSYEALPVIYGREAELGQLATVCQATLAGKSQMLLIGGDPGTGKSLLLSYLAQDWRRMGGLVSQANIINYKRDAFKLWAQWLTQLFGLGNIKAELRGQQFSQAVTDLDPELAEWVPLWGELLNLEITEAAWLRSLDRLTRRQRLAELTPRLLAALAERQPLLLLCDDFQEVDIASLELLDQVLPAITPSRILVSLASRAGQTPALTRLQAGQLVQLSLQALSPTPVQQLIVYKLALKGMTIEPDDLERFTATVSEMSGGNPLFIEELINTWQAENLLEEVIKTTTPVASLSYNLQSLIMARLDSLPGQLREIMLVASVAGHQLTGEILKPLLSSEIFRGRDEAVSGLLEQLCTLDLLRPELASGHQSINIYRFRHTLFQQVAYDSLPFARRRVLHEEAGRYLEDRLTLSELNDALEQLAYHYERSNNSTKAVFYLVRSAERSARLFANQVALQQYQSALQILEQATGALLPGRSELLTGVGEVQAQMADFPAALESFHRALELTSNVLERARLEQRCSEVLLRATRYAEAVEAIQRAEKELEQLKTSRRTQVIPFRERLARAQLAELYSTILLRQAQFEPACQWAETGLGLLEGRSGQSLEAAIVKIKLYQALAGAAAMLQQMPRAQQALAKALRLIQKHENPLTSGLLQLRMAILAMQREQFRKAPQFFRLALPNIEKTGARDRLAHLLLPGGQTFLYRGEFELAKQWLERGLKLAEEVGTPYLICSGQYLLARVEKELGQWEQALDHYSRSAELAEKHGLWDRLAEFLARQGELLAYQGQSAQAELLLQQAITCAEQHQLPTTAKLCYRILAEIYYIEEGFDQAVPLLLKAGITTSGAATSNDRAFDTLRLAEWWALYKLSGKANLSLTTSADEVQRKAQESLLYFQTRNIKLFLPTAQRVNGMVALAQHRPLEAARYFKRGLLLARSTLNLPEQARLLAWRGRLKSLPHFEGSIPSVEHDLNQALALFERLGAQPELAQTRQRLEDLYQLKVTAPRGVGPKPILST